MIEPEWHRIAAVHCLENGDIGAVWLALDKETDKLFLYDAQVFRKEIFGVIADTLKAKGKWIPIAWNQKDVMEKLLERGCNMLPDEAENTHTLAEVISRGILERMRTGRFKLIGDLEDWKEEFDTYDRHKGKLTMETHPLMSATRHAVSMLDCAKSKAGEWRGRTHPDMRLV